MVDLDHRIRAAYRQVLTGPPMRTMPLDVEAVVARWRASRPPEIVYPVAAEPGPSSPAAATTAKAGGRTRRVTWLATVLVAIAVVGLIALLAR